MHTKYLLVVMLPAIALVAIIPMVYADERAVHLDPGSLCAFIDPTQLPNIVATGTGVATGVMTSSGNQQVTCKGTIPDYNGPPVHLDISNTNGLACSVGVPPYLTTNWHQEITPNGKAILVCVSNPGSSSG